MAEFVEQGQHFVVGQQRRVAAQRRGEVAGQIGHRQLQAAMGAATAQALVHPGAATLILARIGVEVEQADVGAVGLTQCVSGDILVPGGDVAHALDLHAVKALDQGEHAVDGLRRREVGAQLFFGETELLLLQLLRVVGRIPGLEIFQAVALLRIGLQLVQFRLRELACVAGQVEQEALDRVGRFRHLGFQRQLGEVFEAEQQRFLVAQRQDLPHQRGVVVLPGQWALVGGAGGVGGVQLLAQLAIVGVADHRVVAGEVESEQEAFKFLRLGPLGCLGVALRRHAGEQAFVADLLAEGLHRIHQIFFELALQLGQPHGDFLVARLFLGRQGDAGEAEVAQRVFHHFLARGRESGEAGLLLEALVGVEQSFVLRHLQAVFGDLGQAGVEGLAPVGGGDDAEQVRHRAPGARDAIAHVFQRLDQALPARLARRGEQGLQRLAIVGEDAVDRCFGMFRPDLVESREGAGRGGGEQGIFHGARFVR